MSRLFCACADAPSTHRPQTRGIRISRLMELLLLRALEAHDEPAAGLHRDSETAGTAGRNVFDVGDGHHEFPVRGAVLDQRAAPPTPAEKGDVEAGGAADVLSVDAADVPDVPFPPRDEHLDPGFAFEHSRLIPGG